MAPDPLPPDDDSPLDADGRSQAKRWLDTWARVGPVLERDRTARLVSMTDRQAQQACRRVLELWQPDWHGDDGEELLVHQRVFARGPG